MWKEKYEALVADLRKQGLTLRIDSDGEVAAIGFDRSKPSTADLDAVAREQSIVAATVAPSNGQLVEHHRAVHGKAGGRSIPRIFRRWSPGSSSSRK